MAKILVAVWEPLIGLLNKKVKQACLKRDEYLDHVLRHEAKMLKQEVGIPNSDEAKAEISKHLGMLRRKQVNLNLSADTVEAIADACQQVNVHRDAFINRVLLFLVAGKKLFVRLLDDMDWEWAERKLVEDYYNYFSPTLDGALPTITDLVKSDPFLFYRACIEITNDDGGVVPALHEAMLGRDFLKGAKGPESAIGFNCHLPDMFVEGHPAKEEMDREIEMLLAALDGDEEDQQGARK